MEFGPQTPARAISECGAAVALPAIMEQSVGERRKLLGRDGWTAMHHHHNRRDDRAAALAAKDITEGSACARTGLATCVFTYERLDAGLKVFTSGEADNPIASGYRTCRAIPPR
ncbi:hypothetical protein JQK15_20435 [Sphingobium sp. BHU LFT2]|uniref:hypothetical protein n=1 Tax=Sphingobium sp. BHU LFT2 TaxID=2807634 RepID=UPI001BE543B1|nr:hypothetical protein [Sphingobium sp. BHU LFT2]MBT2245883.1 hypothetical protein [Sphingobium sp. BHU LFT2]